MPRYTESQRRILIVDDDRQVRTLLSKILRAAGYHPLQAPSAVKAIDVLEKEEVGLMLLDIHMIGPSGIDLLEALQRRRLMLPIIVVSGFVSDVVAKQLLGLGVRGILAKPFEPLRLMEEIRRVVPGVPDLTPSPAMGDLQTQVSDTVMAETPEANAGPSVEEEAEHRGMAES